jgi:hypothetical protein
MDFSSWANNLYQTAKDKASSFTQGLNFGQGTSEPVSGGKRTKKNRRTHLKGGNFHASSPSNGLAAHASPIQNIPTPKFHTVGGKRRKSKCNKHHCNKHHCNKHHRHTSKCRR